MWKTLLIILLLLLPQPALAAACVFDYNIACAKAYQEYMALRLDEGNKVIVHEMMQHPENLMATYIADYEDCLLLMLNSDKQQYQQRKSHFEERLAILEKGDRQSPWYRFTKAGLYMHWALIHFRMGDQLKSATQFRKSYLLLKENARLFPTFEYNNVFLGLEGTLLGTIPDSYKWIANILGLKGDVKKGAASLSAFIKAHKATDPLYHEAAIYHVFVGYFLLSRQDDVWNLVNSSQFPTQNNLLNAFVKANIALSYRKADACIETLKEQENGKDYAKYPIFDYIMASALYNQLNAGCISYFQDFLKRYKGETYVKDSWQKMALAFYLQKNMEKARYCLARINTEGNTQIDADKQAARFYKENVWPNATLLQARLLIDGGYASAALGKLAAVNENMFPVFADRLEYLFRYGRAYQEINNNSQAIKYYLATIKEGRDAQEHFAARAALQMGFIYERAGNVNEAIARYKDALSMRHHDFQGSIDQQAKAGINRLSYKE